jgi:hypothetical protein
VCQQYPASFVGANFHPFIQRRWSAEEFFACFPADVQAAINARPIDQKTMFLYKRMDKVEKRLKPDDGNGEKDFTPFLALMNGAMLRRDGRPDEVKKLQSAAPPIISWIMSHGIRMDTMTGRWVKISPEELATLKEQSKEKDGQLNGEDDSNIDDAETSPELPAEDEDDIEQSTPPPVAPRNSRSQGSTLASFFPNGMINLRGAHVRTMTPDRQQVWDGAPTPAFVDDRVRSGERQLLMEITFPADYRPDTPMQDEVEQEVERRSKRSQVNQDDEDEDEDRRRSKRVRLTQDDNTNVIDHRGSTQTTIQSQQGPSNAATLTNPNDRRFSQWSVNDLLTNYPPTQQLPDPPQPEFRDEGLDGSDADGEFELDLPTA